MNHRAEAFYGAKIRLQRSNVEWPDLANISPNSDCLNILKVSVNELGLSALCPRQTLTAGSYN